MFCKYNPQFKEDLSNKSSSVCFMGHSLGAVLIYDLLESISNGTLFPASSNSHEPSQQQSVNTSSNSDSVSVLRKRSYSTIEMILSSMHPVACFMFGSPLAHFLTIRQPSGPPVIKLPVISNCRMFNLFHPYDAIAYRMEPLLAQGMKDIEPVYVPYRGGHRFHVAVRKLGDSIVQSVSSITSWFKSSIQQQIPVRSDGSQTTTTVAAAAVVSSSSTSVIKTHTPYTQCDDTNTPMEEYVCRLNCGQRIDWVIQESPVEAANEWLAAVSSHFQYWRHEDVMSFIIDRLIYITEEEIRKKHIASTFV